MASPSGPGLSLTDIAAKLATDGPTKHEPSNRRVRGLWKGKWVFDTLEAEYVWEQPYYPFFYIPLTALVNGPAWVTREKTDARGFWLGALCLVGHRVDIIGFDAGPLKGLVKIPVDGIDSWFAEEERLLGPHPKDPYKRIECLPSSREVRIEVDGTPVARSTNNVFLHETGLRTRYYIEPTSILDWGILEESETETYCPYKGKAKYYHLRVGDREVRDAVWFYEYPTAESAAMQGRLCFWDEKVGVFVDGVRV